MYAVVVPELRAIGSSPAFSIFEESRFFVLISAKEALNPWSLYSRPTVIPTKDQKRFLKVKATASVNGKTTETYRQS